VVPSARSREHVGEPLCRRLAGVHQHAQHAPHVIDTAAGTRGGLADLLLEQAAHAFVGIRQRVVEPAHGEHDRVLGSVEAQVPREDTPAIGDVRRRGVRQGHAGRRPLGPAQFTHDVAGERQRGIDDLVGGGDAGLRDLVPERHRVLVDAQRGMAAAVGETREGDEALKCGAYVGRVLHVHAEHAERLDPRHAGALDTACKEAAESRIGNDVVGIVEHREGDACVRHHRGGIDGQAAQDRREGHAGADADDAVGDRATAPRYLCEGILQRGSGHHLGKTLGIRQLFNTPWVVSRATQDSCCALLPQNDVALVLQHDPMSLVAPEPGGTPAQCEYSRVRWRLRSFPALSHDVLDALAARDDVDQHAA
jgi:hypothetical protein